MWFVLARNNIDLYNKIGHIAYIVTAQQYVRMNQLNRRSIYNWDR